MKRVKVTWLGEEEYGSVDTWDEVAPGRINPETGAMIGGLGRLISLQPGEHAYVSEEKAAQLADDFPEMFEFGGSEERESAELNPEDLPEPEVAPNTDPEPEPEEGEIPTSSDEYAAAEAEAAEEPAEAEEAEEAAKEPDESEEPEEAAEAAEEAAAKPLADWKVDELDAAFGELEGYPSAENKPEKVAFVEALSEEQLAEALIALAAAADPEEPAKPEES